jgi:hypothetical protein
LELHDPTAAADWPWAVSNLGNRAAFLCGMSRF